MKNSELKAAIRKDIDSLRERPSDHRLQPADKAKVQEAKKRVMARHAETIKELADM